MIKMDCGYGEKLIDGMCVKVPKRSPWGEVQTADHLGGGIFSVDTAGHGGLKVPPKLNRKIPEYMRESSGWYEEDAEWARVAVALPEYFPPEAVENAKDNLKNWNPQSYERFFGTTIPEGESITKDDHLYQERHKNDYMTLAAWGDWHDKVPPGYVGVFAGRGGRTPEGRYPEDTGYFLVPAEEYQSRGSRSFIIDERRHIRTKPID